MYDKIGRWVVAVVVTFLVSVGVMYLLQKPLGLRINSDVFIAIAITAVAAVSTGPFAEYILKAAKKKNG